MKPIVYQAILAGVTACLGAALPVANAESEFPLSPEFTGMNQVLQVLSTVSVGQTDPKTSQSVQEILDLKSQLYSAQTTSANGLRAAAHGGKNRLLPPSRRFHAL